MGFAGNSSPRVGSGGIGRSYGRPQHDQGTECECWWLRSVRLLLLRSRRSAPAAASSSTDRLAHSPHDVVCTIKALVD